MIHWANIGLFHVGNAASIVIGDDDAIVVAGGDRDVRGRDRGGEGERGGPQAQRTHRHLRATTLKLKNSSYLDKKCF